MLPAHGVNGGNANAFLRPPVAEQLKDDGGEDDWSVGQRSFYAISAEVSDGKTSRSIARYAIMRIILGLLFVSHGGQKLFGWFGGQPVPLGSIFGVAGIIDDQM